MLVAWLEIMENACQPVILLSPPIILWLMVITDPSFTFGEDIRPSVVLETPFG